MAAPDRLSLLCADVRLRSELAGLCPADCERRKLATPPHRACLHPEMADRILPPGARRVSCYEVREVSSLGARRCPPSCPLLDLPARPAPCIFSRELRAASWEATEDVPIPTPSSPPAPTPRAYRPPEPLTTPSVVAVMRGSRKAR